MDFPTLSKSPAYPIIEELEDSVLKTDMEAGYTVTRQRFTRVRKRWRFRYVFIPSSDYNNLTGFISNNTHGGADSFNWANPMTGNNCVVRFDKLPVFTAVLKRGNNTYYDTDEIIFRQV